MRLDPTAEAAGARLVIHDTIDSTNTEALRRARAGDIGPLWIVARQQTSGRGRRGRTWVSEPGNLYATLLLTDSVPMAQAPELSFVAALALHDAIAGRVPGLGARLALKWPNDLLVDRCKVAGILIEGEGAAAALGLGVNCTRHPAGTEFPATDLAAAGVRATPESLFTPLSAAMTARLAVWDCGRSFAAIRSDWLSRASGLGKTMRVAVHDGERNGTFETVDESGQLVLRLADGSALNIAAGDVLHGTGG